MGLVRNEKNGLGSMIEQEKYDLPKVMDPNDYELDPSRGIK